jgi:hypothetical protein
VIPIPALIAERWAPTWGTSVFPTQPWWSKGGAVLPRFKENSGSDVFAQFNSIFGDLSKHLPKESEGWYTRKDGVKIVQKLDKLWFIFDKWEESAEPKTLLDRFTCRGWGARDKPNGWETPEEAAAFADGYTPLPRPPILAGQTWAWVTEDGLCERVIWGVTLRGDTQVEPALEALPPHAILVAGPSCYGFNVPWAPAEAK